MKCVTGKVVSKQQKKQTIQTVCILGLAISSVTTLMLSKQRGETGARVYQEDMLQRAVKHLNLTVLNKPTRCSWAVTFISLVYHSTCFGRFLHPSSGVY